MLVEQNRADPEVRAPATTAGGGACVPTGATAGTPMGPQGLAQLHAGGYRVHSASTLPSITLGCLWATGAIAYKEAELGTHSSGLE